MRGGFTPAALPDLTEEVVLPFASVQLSQTIFVVAIRPPTFMLFAAVT